jgi:tellurite resistance protein TehA-like permease
MRYALVTSLKTSIEHLHPAYFALVMATGIVSIASDLLEMRAIAYVLCWLNLFFFVILWLLTCARFVWHRARFLADLIDHNRAPGFFTTVAATCIFGSQWLIIFHASQLALILWVFAIFLWMILTYTIFTGVTVKESKPTLAEGIHGGWLIAVVATQAVSVLGARLAPVFDSEAQPIIFFALSMWLWGGMLYIWMISLIFYHYVFFSNVARGPDATVLDQHGRGGNFYSIRRDADPRRATIAAASEHAAFSARIYAFLLGHRHLVDSHAGDSSTLAPRL